MTVDIRFTDALTRYRNNRLHPGQFLVALLENDVFRAVELADNQARQQLGDLVAWISMNIPPQSRGDRNRVSDWLAWKDKQR